MADAIRPPERDEVEFSAFGPGYGECLLVHLGDGDWMIVDSCEQSRRLPVLDYLNAMDVDPAAAVKLVVATHWHDDHVRGISDVLAACPKAAFACSGALCPDEVLEAIGALEPLRGGKRTSGVKELRQVLDLLAEPGRESPEAKWAAADRLLYNRPDGLSCQVYSLSPCDSELINASENVLKQVLQGRTGRVPDRNLGAVALLVNVGDATMLLGSDLQENPGEGWTKVLGCQAVINRQSEIFKVPHHGSRNGHLDLVWDHMLVTEPEAVVCPHSNGGNNIPTPADLDRLCGLANVHLTAPAARHPVIEKGRFMQPAVADCGRVTLRRRHDATTWTVAYAGKAGRHPPDDPG